MGGITTLLSVLFRSCKIKVRGWQESDTLLWRPFGLSVLHCAWHEVKQYLKGFDSYEELEEALKGLASRDEPKEGEGGSPLGFSHTADDCLISRALNVVLLARCL